MLIYITNCFLIYFLHLKYKNIQPIDTLYAPVFQIFIPWRVIKPLHIHTRYPNDLFFYEVYLRRLPYAPESCSTILTLYRTYGGGILIHPPKGIHHQMNCQRHIKDSSDSHEPQSDFESKKQHRRQFNSSLVPLHMMKPSNQKLVVL